MASIRDRLNRDAVGWRPKVGDIVEGVVVEIDTRTGEYGDYPVVIIETDSGDLVAVHGFHSVLKSELARKRPEPGNKIGVKYCGVPSGKSYEMYRVEVERPTAAPDWDRIAVEAAAEQAVFDEPDPEPPADFPFGDEERF